MLEGAETQKVGVGVQEREKQRKPGKKNGQQTSEYLIGLKTIVSPETHKTKAHFKVSF